MKKIMDSAKTESINNIISLLDIMHPNAVCELDYKTPFELLVAVMLSAQCTDKRVNIVTKKLFTICNTPQQFAKIDIEVLKQLIHSCGFYNSKAESLISASKNIVENFNGNVPQLLEQLITLKGVGRKTANVIIAEAFNGQAIAVDTHLLRVSFRLGLSTNRNNPIKTEQELMDIFPKQMWGHIHHLLIHQGRYICKATKPMCESCKLTSYCKFYKEGKYNE